MATKRGEKRNIDDNKRISRRNTEKSSEAEKRIRLSDDNVEVNKKSIEKLLRTNSQIISKLEVLITRQKNLEIRLSGIEKKLNDDNKNNNTIDPEYIKEFVKKVLKILFENFIYPSQDEYRLATEKYLKDENPEFIRQFKKNQWIIFFEKKIAPTLVQQHRSIRGTFMSRVKDVMYSVFKATGHKLPSINTQVSPSKIQEWKSKPEVKRCYNNLFKKVKDGQSTTYMLLIIDKLRKENKNPSKTQIAYAISICETYLNPNNQNIQMSESIMKSKIINNLQKLENRDKFTHSDDDSHDGNDVDNGGDGAADDGAGAADNGATNDGRPNDSAVNDSAANNGAANDGIADDDILSSDSYNTEEEGRYVNSLLENYGLHRK
ncbi:hypothetical protein GLOIN_2v1735248 [Rhizophagus clarus]|uniref:Uncharacterized protein n=1 Tax=Rhizophagus clarus TaxID=94130 RepID=A0A8H3QLA7_9GLOM|nr:hypothetical protein GLOIN_2v1735248 [Rhizophagus clarus]